MSEIIQNKLFLGSVDDALNEKWLQTRKIKLIITVFKDPEEYIEQIKEFALSNNIINYIVPVSDTSDEKILENINNLYNTIESYDSVLIHCMHGISRSATIVISYLMLKYKIHLDEATRIVLKKRNYIFPNDGFIKQLIALEYKIFGIMTYLPNIEGLIKYKRLLQGYDK